MACPRLICRLGPVSSRSLFHSVIVSGKKEKLKNTFVSYRYNKFKIMACPRPIFKLVLLAYTISLTVLRPHSRKNVGLQDVVLWGRNPMLKKAVQFKPCLSCPYLHQQQLLASP